MQQTQSDQEYVLGTHDEEISRLALQHRIWRPTALDAWQRAGFTVGQTLMDVGCGPGHASVDLAEIVGPSGRVVAVDASRRFLDFLQATVRHRGIGNVEAVEANLDQAEPPRTAVDGAWCRWIFSFVNNPRRLLENVRAALRPGGVLVLHEYFHYETWRLTPRSEAIEHFVQVVMKSWRANGGEPDIALDLSVWLGEMQFEIRELRPIVDVVPRTSFKWQWPRSFLLTYPQRLVKLGHLTQEQAEEIVVALEKAEAAPNAYMVTPAVLEIIAVRK
jgi:ubiquinone/menaquinone biosynthesis C-methylase UbiE